MTTTTTSRRSVLAGIAAAPALAAPVLAGDAGDVRLRELWAQYLDQVAAERAAHFAIVLPRAAYDAEEPPCPPNVVLGDHLAACRPLWEKHGLDRLYAAWSAAIDRMGETAEAIREQEAEGLFGIGVKLAALPAAGNARDSAPDHEEAILSALSEIDRLIGTSFVASFSVHIPRYDVAADEDEAEEMAVQS
jgi:hypothetical protein